MHKIVEQARMWLRRIVGSRGRYRAPNRRSIRVKIDNLTEAQALALGDLFAMWVRLGNIGASRWTAFYSDGDGSFRPRIKVNGRRPESFGDGKKRWTRLFNQKRESLGESYMLDFDEIGWALHKEPGDSDPPGADEQTDGVDQSTVSKENR